jgi:histidine phosphotransfer protein HptB
VALIDWQRVDDLTNEIGMDAIFEVLTMFLEETDEVMDRLSTTPPTTEDYHFLKGSALNLGLSDLAALCQLGEQETKADLASDQTLSAVRAVYPASKAALLEGIAKRIGN